jgi:glycosyltransferase involved in cell wall biosynthesis
VRAVILMSTFNGESFLDAQMGSILSQEGIDELFVYIRDDGSTDNTISIIKSYQLRHKNIFLDVGLNIGPCASFFQLLEYAKTLEAADIYLFSDQDDLWLPEKIMRSYEALKKIDEPALYSSSLSIVDRKLDALGTYQHRQSGALFDPIFINSVTGCSSAWNYKFLKLVRIPGDLSNILMHDWWLYLTAMYLGKFHYDQKSSILYRQHGGNVVGIQSFWRKLITLSKSSGVGSMSRIKQFLIFVTEYRKNLIRIDSFKFLLSSLIQNESNLFKLSILILFNVSGRALLSALTFR